MARILLRRVGCDRLRRAIQKLVLDLRRRHRILPGAAGIDPQLFACGPVRKRDREPGRIILVRVREGRIDRDRYHARQRLYPRVVDRVLAERRQRRRPVRERIGDDILQIELRRFGIGRILLARAVGGIFRDAGLDGGDVGHARPELFAKLERGVDAGMDHAAAGIALGAETTLREIGCAAEIVERVGLPFEPAREGAREPAAAFDRRRICGEAARPEQRRQNRIARPLPHM